MADKPDLRTREVYIVTDPGNPEWDVLVSMNLKESERVWAAGYVAELFAQIARPGAVEPFEAFAAEYLDD